jgi:Galactose oxidase, central domain/Kelch motif
MKKSWALLIAACSFCLLHACGGGTSTPPPPPPPVATHLSVAAPANAAAGTAFNFTVTALDAGNNVVASYSGRVHFTSTDGRAVLPANSALTNGTGTFSATLMTGGSQTITVTDTVTVSTMGSSTSITVTTVATLSINSGAPPNGTVGLSYNQHRVSCMRGTPNCVGIGRCMDGVCVYFTSGFIVTASGGISPYTWSWAAATGSSLPSGLVFSAVGDISGTPTTAGTYNVIVTVTDSETPSAQASNPYTITIAPPPPLVITSSAPPTGTLQVAYGGSSGFSLTASGGVGPYAWSWVAATGSSLPPGLQLAGSAISGIPTISGTYQGIVTVSDSESPAQQTPANYSIVINNPPPPMIITSPAPPAGALNVPYVGFNFVATGGLTPLNWSETGALPPGLAFSSEGVLSGKPTATGAFPITVMVQDSLGQNATPQNFTMQIATQAAAFKATGSMANARVWHTATLLGDGTVLVTGGVNNTTFPVMAELFDPKGGTFTTTGSMATVRDFPTATLLNTGKVLVAGGKDSSGSAIATAEQYDPTDKTFSPASGGMQSSRVYHTATLLSDGKVLLTGGLDAAGSESGTPVDTAELFDPASGTFTSVGKLGTARFFHTATLLGSGKVLITGGLGGGSGAATSAELFDPVTNSFTPAGNMMVARAGHTATLLNTGKVLLVGGAPDFGDNAAATAELFDPLAATFTLTGNMVAAHSFHTATLLNNGNVLVAGGDSFFYNGTQSQSLSTAEVYDPLSGSFSATANMTTARESHTATLLQSGEVLIVGGSSGTLGYSATTIVLATAELYQ